MTHIIEINHLSKKYKIHHESQGGYHTLRETLTNHAKKFVKKLKTPFKRVYPPSEICEEFWALKDINLQINEGDRVGIIGRNGAGKSTLLKILSKITAPTKGQVLMRGRVSSLLEVGTGFHPELTGKENIFLNGAILGMRREEIKRKFNDIVSFAEIDQFLDTPVKRYSSGMIARLGFAIAAHLDPDILIIDEVLAVGDATFQNKCLKKLNDLGTHGRTVLFVSHDIGSVLSLCNKGIYLEKGSLNVCGPIDQCVSEYMRHFRMISMNWKGDVGDENIRFYSASLRSENQTKEFFYQQEKAIVELEYEVLKPSQDICIEIGVWNQRNQLLAHSSTFDDSLMSNEMTHRGRRLARFIVDSSLFHEGDYLIKLDCIHHNHRNIVVDEIVLKHPIYSQSGQTRLGYTNARTGIFLGKNWQLK